MASVSIKTTRLNFASQLSAFKSFKASYPRFVGNMAVNFFKDSFKRQGFIDDRIEKWEPRKFNNKNKGRRAILVKSGRLRRSIRVLRSGLGYVVVGTDVPYAKIHNEGGIIRATQNVGSHTRKAHKRTWRNKKQNVSATTVRKHTRIIKTRIKKRQFIGKSNLLMKRIAMNTNYRIKQILNIK